MAWILDEYSKFHGYSPAVVTGKPIVSSRHHDDFISKCIIIIGKLYGVCDRILVDL